jgi:hypothetical protein
LLSTFQQKQNGLQLRCGMRYAIVIWFIAAFVLWDTHQNRGQYTRPLAHIAYRIAGGHAVW